jgi:hypothetical protein
VGEEAGALWRGIDELAALVGHYCWFEERLFTLTGGWATREGTTDVPPAIRVWLAGVSRRHGEMAGRFAERLPHRAGVDAGALVAPPATAVDEALASLASAEATSGVAALVEVVLPWLAGTYGAHLAEANPASEAPVMEVLAEGRREALAEASGGVSLLARQPPMEASDPPGDHWVTIFKRAFEGMRIFPAVRTS